MKLDRKQMVSGHQASDFVYRGRPAKTQDDFGTDVGIADCACVNQFGEANNSKYYHGGVVQSIKDNSWYCYFEWGRISAGGKSWEGFFRGQDFQFVPCSSEAEARTEFRKQMQSKNTKRLERKMVGSAQVWAAKEGKDGYIVQALATRERGLPDAYGIKDDEGLAAKKPSKAAIVTPSLSRDYHPKEVELAQALIGGAQVYTRALSKSSGVTPTLSAIKVVRDELIPAAMERLQQVRAADLVQDSSLQAVSKMVFAMIPRDIPRAGLSPEDAILSNANILRLQQDLDAFEAALQNEDFEVESGAPTVDADRLLNAQVRWLDPTSERGRWVEATYRAMTRNRHGDLSGRPMRIHNLFEVTRPDRDARFVAAAQRVGATPKSNPTLAGLQPVRRPDLSDISDVAAQANVFLGIHGTRGVNVGPILQSHLRLPKSLKGVTITGAAFGHGIYFATDLGKSWGYTGYSSRWGASGGNLQGRGAFMFLADVIGGRFHYPRAAWTLNSDECPKGHDSVFAHPNYVPSLANDEHIIFNPDYCRLRYIVEMSF